MKSGRFEHNRTPGVGWSIHENFPPPSFPCTVSDETQTHYTTVRLSDREYYRFRPRLVNLATSLGSCYADVTYEFVDGQSTGATLEILSNTAVVYVNGSDQVIDDTPFSLGPEAVCSNNFCSGRPLQAVCYCPLGSGLYKASTCAKRCIDAPPTD